MKRKETLIAKPLLKYTQKTDFLHQILICIISSIELAWKQTNETEMSAQKQTQSRKEVCCLVDSWKDWFTNHCCLVYQKPSAPFLPSLRNIIVIFTLFIVMFILFVHS